MPKWTYTTKRGLAEIVADRGGFTLIFDGQALERHTSPAVAAEALANGTCMWPSFGDPSKLGIPEDINEWAFAR